MTKMATTQQITKYKTEGLADNNMLAANMTITPTAFKNSIKNQQENKHEIEDKID
jgi:hypothetical protein